MKLTPHYRWKTRVGSFYISQCDKGLFHPVFEDESLGGYHTPDQAIDDLAGGHTFSIRDGIDTSKLGILDDIAEWEKRTPHGWRKP